MKRKRFIIAAVAALGLVLSAGNPAYAYVSKSGTKPCANNYTGKTTAYSSGFTEHYPPGGGYSSYANGSFYYTTQASANVTKGGFWFVATDGGIIDSGTYATCFLSGTV